MKTKILILAIMALFSSRADAQPATPKIAGKSIIIYYSRPGNNYVGGQIVNLKTGNTEVAALKIKQLTGADIFRIEPVKAYPADYDECTRVAQEELRKQARPAYKGDAVDLDQYDTVYLGYPNWWGTMPMVVCTFLERHPLAGKQIHPFCTNEGSGMGHSESDLRKLCPKATVKSGLSIRGGAVASSDKLIENWLKK